MEFILAIGCLAPSSPKALEKWAKEDVTDRHVCLSGRAMQQAKGSDCVVDKPKKGMATPSDEEEKTESTAQ